MGWGGRELSAATVMGVELSAATAMWGGGGVENCLLLQIGGVGGGRELSAATDMGGGDCLLSQSCGWWLWGMYK